MWSALGPVGVPNESSASGFWSFGPVVPTSLTISGAKTAARTRSTMNTPAASATLSCFSRRQNSSNGDRAAIAVGLGLR